MQIWGVAVSHGHVAAMLTTRNSTSPNVSLSRQIYLIPVDQYNAWYINQRSHGALVVTDSTFPHAADLIIEHKMSSHFRLDNMWRKDLLAYWHWKKHKTGILTAEERVDAILGCYFELVPPPNEQVNTAIVSVI